MRILISGATGLIGKALGVSLANDGHEVIGLVRQKAAFPGLAAEWDPESNRIEAEALEGLDAVVHLAGENIASARWSPDKKRRILDSRVKGTGLLSTTLAERERPPKVLVSGSAIGVYGNRGDEILDERSGGGAGFLPDVCRQWEDAAEPARKAGIRVVCLRTGVVLTRQGGALAKMLPPFRWGVGGIIGNGQACMSWITLADLLRAIKHTLCTEALSGPVNAVAPHPVTNRAFSKALGNALHRPAILPMPEWAVQLLFGEMGREMLLTSTHVLPRRLEETGFSFLFPEIGPALEHVLKK